MNNALSNLKSSIIATRKIFFVTGFGLASWAPFIPIVKNNLDIHDGMMGVVLLSFGIGSILMMSLSGLIVGIFGCRNVYLILVVIFSLSLLAVMLSSNLIITSIAIFTFGAGIGGADVVININAVAIQKKSNRSLMSGFHALFSLGGISGASFVSIMLYLGFSSISIVVIMFFLFAFFINTSIFDIIDFDKKKKKQYYLMKSNGKIIIIGLLCLIGFLVEGSMLDWSGIFLLNKYNLKINQVGTGYIIFAIFMTLGRVYGDRTISKFGDKITIIYSIIILLFGLITLIISKEIYFTFFSFSLIGLGIANIAPILFTLAGKQNDNNESMAISSVATIGYSGILLGPAVIGFIAHLSSLTLAFLLVTILVLIMLIITFKFILP
ncbi:MFS transporter [Providencia rettgeri]|uniref:MFS transporter n=1 Tax=Providencia rettgeri TaxID=587 RepID=UPI003017712B